MRSILLHIYDDDGLESRLQVALDLARSFNAHLSCLQAVNYEVVMPGDFYGSIVLEMLPHLREQAAKLRQDIEKRLKHEDVRWDWIAETGMMDNRLIEHASLNDLVIMGADAPGRREGVPSYLVGTLAVHARTPLLVVPDAVKSFDPAADAFVCWDGSAEAANALRAAVPLLGKANRVSLATVVEKRDRNGEDLPSTQGAEYLSRHGIECEMVELPDEGRHPAETLMASAHSRKAGYVVMGAYGRPRLLEGVFGGVTRKMLSGPQFPLFVAH